MNYTNAALSYGLLLIPTIFAVVVMSQGVYKITKKDESGKTILGMGIFFLILIPFVYFFLIKV